MARSVARQIHEQLGLNESLATNLIYDHFQGKYVSACVALICQQLIQMEKDAKFTNAKQVLKQKRLRSLTSEIITFFSPLE